MFLTFQKIEGCNKMTCAKCRCYFCWVCNTMLDTRNPYVHFTDTNLKCYNQLMARVEVENHITVPYVKIWMQVILVIEQSVRKRCTFILGVFWRLHCKRLCLKFVLNLICYRTKCQSYNFMISGRSSHHWLSVFVEKCCSSFVLQCGFVILNHDLRTFSCRLFYRRNNSTTEKILSWIICSIFSFEGWKLAPVWGMFPDVRSIWGALTVVY